MIPVVAGDIGSVLMLTGPLNVRPCKSRAPHSEVQVGGIHTGELSTDGV